MTQKVLLCSGEGEDFFHILDDVEGYEITRCQPSELAEAAKDIDIYYGHPTVEMLKIAPKLKWIQSPSAGVEFVAKLPELVASNIILTNTRGAHGPSIGEHAMALLLALTRHIPESIEQQNRKHWERGRLYRTAREVGGMTMGIIGFGALGRGIAQRAKAFEMNVIAVDAYATDGAGLIESVWPITRLNDLLAQSDAVVIAAPLTGETHHMIGAEQLAQMKDDAYLIVVSRGGIVEEGALLETLKRGRLAGAGIDVVEHEPMPADDPFWDAPRMILTPHLAGASAPKERRVVQIFKDNLNRYRDGQPLINVVDKARGF